MVVQLWPAAGDEAEAAAAEIQEALSHAARAAAAPNLQRSGSGTGEILRSNFLLLLDHVLRDDRHLFSEDELQIFQNYKASTDLTAALRSPRV